MIAEVKCEDVEAEVQKRICVGVVAPAIAQILMAKYDDSCSSARPRAEVRAGEVKAIGRPERDVFALPLALQTERKEERAFKDPSDDRRVANDRVDQKREQNRKNRETKADEVVNQDVSHSLAPLTPAGVGSEWVMRAGRAIEATEWCSRVVSIQPAKRRKIKATFWPPNPKLLVSAASTFLRRATWGT